MARDLVATMFETPLESVEVTLTEGGAGGVDSVVEAWHAEVAAQVTPRRG